MILLQRGPWVVEVDGDGMLIQEVHVTHCDHDVLTWDCVEWQESHSGAFEAILGVIAGIADQSVDTIKALRKRMAELGVVDEVAEWAAALEEGGTEVQTMLDDLVHDHASIDGSSINNEGALAQCEFLVRSCGGLAEAKREVEANLR